MSEEQVVVQNLTNDNVVYIDDNGGVTRRIIFHPQQSMSLPRDLIARMAYDRGGAYLLKEVLSVKDEEIKTEIGVPQDQIEYDWTVKDVDECLLHGSCDELRDALDFAPQAIRDLIIARAVALPLNDREKGGIISDMTGRNIENMIAVKQAAEKDVDTSKTTPSSRRVQKKEETTGRRVATEKVSEE